VRWCLRWCWRVSCRKSLVDGHFEATGTMPAITTALTDRGEDVADWMFAPEDDS